MLRIFSTFLLIFLGATAQQSFAQGFIDDIGSSDSKEGSTELFTETLNTIAMSRKIFLITNTNQNLFKGDFITIVLDNQYPVAKAVVAKIHQGLAGIKILKIYSLKQWSRLKKDMDIQVHRGCNTALFKKKEKKKGPEKEMITSTIRDEKDLYNDTGIEGDIDLLRKDSRLIKPDNLVSGKWSSYTFDNDLRDGETEVHNEWVGAWAYQFYDNFWVEGSYGRVLMDDFPATSTQTLINNFMVRLKYTFDAPWYSYILPYIGYQQYTVSSPDAGNTNDLALKEAELSMIDNFEHHHFTYGITLLKRLVPGWFLQLNAGNDIIDVGFSVEF